MLKLKLIKWTKTTNRISMLNISIDKSIAITIYRSAAVFDNYLNRNLFEKIRQFLGNNDWHCNNFYKKISKKQQINKLRENYFNTC